MITKKSLLYSASIILVTISSVFAQQSNSTNLEPIRAQLASDTVNFRRTCDLAERELSREAKIKLFQSKRLPKKIALIQDDERVKQWDEDLDYLLAELPQKHVKLYHTVSPEKFKSEIDRLRQNVFGMSDVEIMIKIQQILTLVGEDHTNANLMPFLKHPPLLLRKFDDGIYITAVALTEFSRAVGARIIRVGNESVETAAKKISTVISKDPGNTSSTQILTPFYLGMPEVLFALKTSSSKSEVLLTLKDKNGIFKMNVPATLSRQDYLKFYAAQVKTSPMKYEIKPDDSYWAESIPDKKTVYIRYRYGWQMQKLAFKDFTEQVLTLINKENPQKVIVDLRDNPGGNSSIILPLVDGLKSFPQVNKKGHLFILINHGMRSSGMFNAIDFREQTEAILIGNPTGARPWSYGEVLTLELPNSKLRIIYSTKFWKKGKTDSPSVAPDINVKNLSQDYFSGKDQVLEAALSYYK